jgi:hypothetical protein
MSSPPWTSGLRLPTTVVPRKYDVAIAPDLVQFTFQGSVRIDFDVTQTTSDIVCHSFELTYAKGQDGKPLVQLFAAGATEPIQHAIAIELDESSQRVSRMHTELPAAVSSVSPLLMLRCVLLSAGSLRLRFADRCRFVHPRGCVRGPAE